MVSRSRDSGCDFCNELIEKVESSKEMKRSKVATVVRFVHVIDHKIGREFDNSQ